MNSELIKQSKQIAPTDFSFGGEVSFSTDSRNINGANAFLCLYGERFDAFNFIESLLDQNLDLIFFEDRPGRDLVIKELRENHSGKNIPELVPVKDIFEFLLELGSLNSEDFQSHGGRIIGLTGSNGKTTNKEMLAWLADGIRPGKVLWTKGNLNNHIGVPLTLLRLNRGLEVAIIEMGTNHPGEIEILAKTARPTHAMITNIGHAHLEFLKDLEGVFKEKTALFRETEKMKDAFLVVNQLDPYLKKYSPSSSYFALNQSALQVTKNGFNLNVEGNSLTIENLSLLGDHQKINMAQCLSMALHLFPDNKERLVELANSFTMPSMNRGDMVKLGQMEVFLDAYNANPDSMRASLASFQEVAAEKGAQVSECLFVLGDMNELGQSAKEQHRLLGEFLKNIGASKVCFVGRYCTDYCAGFGETDQFDDAREVRPWLLRNSAKLAFIKGSRSLQLESILDIKEV